MAMVCNVGSSYEQSGVSKAIALYEASIAAHPTAEGFTYLAWMYSMQVRFGFVNERLVIAGSLV